MARAWNWMAIVVCVGCAEPPRGQVEGTLSRRGQPLVDVMVTFVAERGPAGPAARATALTDEQGRFRLKADDQRDGIRPGQYRVTLQDNAVARAPRSDDGTLLKRPPVRFPPRYGDPTQTPLRQQVQAGAQSVTLTADDER